MSEINYNCCLVKDIVQLSIKEILLKEMMVSSNCWSKFACLLSWQLLVERISRG